MEGAMPHTARALPEDPLSQLANSAAIDQELPLEPQQQPTIRHGQLPTGHLRPVKCLSYFQRYRRRPPRSFEPQTSAGTSIPVFGCIQPRCILRLRLSHSAAFSDLFQSPATRTFAKLLTARHHAFVMILHQFSHYKERHPCPDQFPALFINLLRRTAPRCGSFTPPLLLIDRI
jgi:hypothetical protein